MNNKDKILIFNEIISGPHRIKNTYLFHIGGISYKFCLNNDKYCISVKRTMRMYFCAKREHEYEMTTSDLTKHIEATEYNTQLAQQVFNYLNQEQRS